MAETQMHIAKREKPIRKSYMPLWLQPYDTMEKAKQ